MTLRGSVSRLDEESCWLDLELRRQAFEGFQAQVPLATFDAAEVGPVEAEVIGEVLLADPTGPFGWRERCGRGFVASLLPCDPADQRATYRSTDS